MITSVLELQEQERQDSFLYSQETLGWIPARALILCTALPFSRVDALSAPLSRCVTAIHDAQQAAVLHGSLRRSMRFHPANSARLAFPECWCLVHQT